MRLKFEPTGFGNEVIRTLEFGISFKITGEPNLERPETAVYMNGIWYILNGDFRKEFEEAANKGPLAILETIGTLSEFQNKDWSTCKE